jgi:hypothetical protein
MEYTLTAELGSKKKTKKFAEVSDEAASFAAIGFIMDAAYKDQSGPWALGRITLIDADGSLVREPMEAK